MLHPQQLTSCFPLFDFFPLVQFKNIYFDWYYDLENLGYSVLVTGETSVILVFFIYFILFPVSRDAFGYVFSLSNAKTTSWYIFSQNGTKTCLETFCFKHKWKRKQIKPVPLVKFDYELSPIFLYFYDFFIFPSAFPITISATVNLKSPATFQTQPNPKF